MLQRAITNTLETWKKKRKKVLAKSRKSKQRNGRYKGEQNGNIRIEICNNISKNLVYGLNSRMERKEDRTSELENKTM